MKNVILDMDPGVDDALAILLAYKSRLLNIKAISVVSGNISLDNCVKNVMTVLQILEIEEKDLPTVAPGAPHPLYREPIAVPSIHGADGLGEIGRFIGREGEPLYPQPKSIPTGQSAVSTILDTISKTSGKITIIATGPLTNIAQAILEDSRMMKRIEELIIMAGAFKTSGNITAAAEFNAYADPDALQIVLNSGIKPLTIVGLDVTHKARLFRTHAQEMQAKHGTKIGRFVLDCTDFYMNFHREAEGFDGCYLHDPLAVGAALRPEILKTQDLFVQAETCGSISRGLTLADFRSGGRRMKTPNARVALEVDQEAFLSLFSEAVFS